MFGNWKNNLNRGIFKCKLKKCNYCIYAIELSVFLKQIYPIVWFGSSPTPFPLSHEQVVSLSVFQCVAGRASWREGGGGGERGAKSYDR
jgi:hypothetical protein